MAARSILFLALLSILLFPAFSQGKEVRGIAHWSNGKGDCGANQASGYAGNGTGYIEDFRIRSYYVVDDKTISFHFINFNGKEFFGPLTGPLDDEGNFDAKAHYEPHDEDYRLAGKLGQDAASGTFTRLAHYSGAGLTGPRCTATWTVDFRAEPWPDGPPAAAGHPTTVSKPPAVQPAAPPTPTVSEPPPEKTPPPTSGHGLLIGGMLAGVGAAIIMIARKLKKHARPECRCELTVKLTGPAQLNLPRCMKAKTWRMRPEPGDSLRGLLDVGDGADRHYTAEVSRTCTGGGRIDIEELNWSASRKATDAGTIILDLKAIRRCPGEPDAPVFLTQTMAVAVALNPCCGPDITDGYVAAINRIYRKLSKDLPFSSTAFMTQWGTRMIYRPHAPGAVFASDCPSEGCNDTVTILGKCYDCYVGDNLLFGIVAGFLKLSVVELEVGGWAAKLAKQFAISPHMTSEGLWRKGHAIGEKARNRLDEHKTYEFDRVLLREALHDIPPRQGCRPCEAKGPEQAFIDFSQEPW